MSDVLFPEMKKLITNIQRVVTSDELPTAPMENLCDIINNNEYSNSLRRSLKRIRNTAGVHLTDPVTVMAFNTALKEHGLADTWATYRPTANNNGVLRLPNGMVTW